ncbi:hypothetical protein MOUN0_I00848 [Monosporozyma unispora]|nr:hypothetical protein C6P44_002128 [Kazachstania unispora]
MVTVINAVVCIITVPLVASFTLFISMAVYSEYQTREEDERDANLTQIIQEDIDIDEADINWGRDVNHSQIEDSIEEDITFESEDHRPVTLQLFDQHVPIIATDLKEYFSSFKR